MHCGHLAHIGGPLTDIVDVQTRSKMMSNIKGKNTSPEISIRKALHARGFRFRLHAKELPGKPDLILPKHRAAIFVNGCFWHGHTCRYFKLPRTRPEFWLDKINSNRQRDIRQIAALNEAGWRVLLIWECAIRAEKKEKKLFLVDAVQRWLLSGPRQFEIDEKVLLDAVLES